MEQWNSVRIKFNVSREVAAKLKELAEQDNEILRNLGILSVQIDNDKLLKLNLTPYENNKEQTTELKRNDTLTKLLERQSPPNAINLPFIVNNSNKIENNNFIVQQQHPQSQQQNIYHHNQQTNIHPQPSTSHQQNEIIDRQLAFLNQNKNSSIKLNSNEDNLLINRPIQSINNPPICNNIGAASPINQLNQLNQHQNLNKQPLLNKNVQQQPQQQQTYSYVNMQQPANQLNKLNDKNLINKPNNLINQNIKINNLSNIQQQTIATTIPTQNIVQQIQFKPYPLPQQSPLNSPQTSNNGNNIINIKQSYVRNPNIKLTAAPTVINNQLPNQQQQQQSNQQQFKPNQLDLNKDQLNNSQSLNQPNSSSNVALTSPLLVNLLQSDVNDHYSSNVNHLSLTNTLSNNSNTTNSNLTSSSTAIKEPPAKKQKTAKATKRKLKDKPPDQQLQVNINSNNNQIKQTSQQNQLNKTTKLNINSNEIIKVTTVNSTTPSNNIQYHQIDNKQLQFSNSIVNSSIITIPTVTLSSNNLQPINNVSNTYQQTTFINAQSQQQQMQQQTNCSYSTNQPIYQISSNNSSTIVNQIKLTNSEIITTSSSNNNQFIQTNNHQLNQINQVEQQPNYSPQITKQQQQQPQQQQPQLTNSTSLINNNNNLIINKTPINSSSINNSPGYFQKLSSLTNDSTSSSNLIVQNSTIVNTSIINNNFSTTSNPILPHNQTNDSIFNLPSPEEENKTKHLINPFTGQLEPFTGQLDSLNSEDEIDTLTSNSTTNSNNTIINSNLNMTTNSINNQFDNQNQFNKLGGVGDLQNNHLSDTDSGISKSTNDANSQSSTELITANDLLNNQDNQTSLVNFDNELINDNTLKNKLGINDMLNSGNNDLITNDLNNKLTNNTDSINQQVFMLNNSLDKQKSAIETTTNDQIDDYFNTPDLGDLNQLTDSLVTDSNATCTTNSTTNLVSSTIPFTDTSSNLLGNDISTHTEELNVNDFLIKPLEQQIKTVDFNSNDDKQVTIESDHNYTNSGDHNYTNFKRPCSFTQNTTNNTANNICNNKIKKVNS